MLSQHQGQESQEGSRLLEASTDGSDGGGSVDRAASETHLRSPKRPKTAWPRESQAEGRQKPQQQQGRQQHDSGVRAASLPRSRPPLQSANVDARAPQDADSGTDTDDDDDLLERVRKLTSHPFAYT
jgi:hypothetical protein